MRIDWEILERGEIERVDREARGILERTGLEVLSGDLRELLKKEGARIEGERVRFPSELIDESLEAVPQTFALYELSGRERSVAPGESYFSLYSNGLLISEPGAEKLRPSSKKDVADFAALGQALPQVDVVPDVCYACDFPEPLQLAHTIEAVLSRTTKLVTFAPQNARQAEIFHEMVGIASGDSGRSAWQGCVSTTSPLRLDGDSAETLYFLASRGIPFVTAPCPMCGGTSPYSLMGTLVLQTAENLALVAMAQSVARGTPLVMGGAAGPMDMRTGALAYGAPERSLLIGANNQIQRFYGLPTHSASIAVNGWQSDVQTGLERELIVFTRMLYRPNFWGGAGAMCSGRAVSLAQVLIDCHAVEMTRRYLEGIDSRESLWGVDSIERVGPGGNYMMDPMTLELIHSSEMWHSPLTNMEEDRGRTMAERAGEEARRILEDFETPVEEGVGEELGRYVERIESRGGAE